MGDTLTKAQRSYCMSRIRSRNTKPEIQLKPTMKTLGFVYQPKMYGSPDFANKKLKIVVFVDGCFWHGCRKHFKAPQTNKVFWLNKINKNIDRDKEISRTLKRKGWGVIRVWEHNLTKLK